MVSVIIPIYNVRRFIGRGLQQLKKQTYKDFEILLVDDGSVDGSYELCKQTAQQDSRIRVLHQQNQGAGGARNLGIENARGEYIYFFDIDDEISPLLLEYNVKIMEQKEVEIIVFGYRNVDTIYKSEVVVSFSETLLRSNSQLRDVYVDNFIMKVNGFPWNKFYRKSFLDSNNLRFENQRIQQDEVFNLICYKYVKKMFISPEVLYTYYVYEKGNTRSHFIPDRFDIYKSVRWHFEDLKNFWELQDNQLNNYLNKRFYDSVIQCLIFNLMHDNCPWSREEKEQEIQRINGDPLTKQAYVWAADYYTGFEHKLIRIICQNGNLCCIQLISILLQLLHNLKRKIK